MRMTGRGPTRRRGRRLLLLASLCALVAIVGRAFADPYVTFPGDYRTMLLSRPSGADSHGADGNSFAPAISQDAKWIAFASFARDLGAGTHRSEVFARKVASQRTILISRANGARGAKADGSSGAPAISGGGRKVAFTSLATNLGGRRGVQGVYLRNLLRGTTTLVSRANGRRGAAANADSFAPSIDQKGDRVVFASAASNLPGAVPGVTQVYLRDLRNGRTILVSRADDGSPGNGDSTEPEISADGGAVVFQSRAGNLGAPPGAATQVYERDLRGGRTIVVSTDEGGRVANAAAITPAVDGDGRKVAFASRATNLDSVADRVQNVFVKDLGSGAILLNSRSLGNQHGQRVDNGPPANGDSFDPSFPRDGNFVCFASLATNLGNRYDGFGVDTSVENVYVHSMRNRSTFLISRMSGRYGHGGNGDSSHVACSAGASLATFQSRATNLSGAATHGVTSVYRRTIFGGH
jgi:Tol biopolymer transport system component